MDALPMNESDESKEVMGLGEDVYHGQNIVWDGASRLLREDSEIDLKIRDNLIVATVIKPKTEESP